MIQINLLGFLTLLVLFWDSQTVPVVVTPAFVLYAVSKQYVASNDSCEDATTNMAAFLELFFSVCVHLSLYELPSQGKARAFPCYACDDPPTVVWKSEGWDSRGRQVAASRGAPLPVAGGGSGTQQLWGHYKKKKLRVGGHQCVTALRVTLSGWEKIPTDQTWVIDIERP